MEHITTLVLTIAGGLIGGFISHYFTQKTEEYKYELLKREQAANAGELFSLWLSCDDDVLNEWTPEQRRDHIQKLHKALYELVFWIPDEQVVKNLLDKLSNKSKEDFKKNILEIREQIQGKKNTLLKYNDVVFFKHTDTEKKDEGIPSV